jgi:integrase
MPTLKLSKRTVDAALPGIRDAFLWDSELTGFGLKVTPAGRKVYVCQYRLGGGRRGKVRRFTIGQHGVPWTVESARAEAKRILGSVANGHDPATAKQKERSAPTIAELCDLYLAEGCATKKPSTLATDRGRIERHIKPLLGARKVRDLTRADVRRFLQDVANGKTAADLKTGKRGRAIVKGGRGTATRTVGLLGGMLSYAVERGIVAENVARGVKRFPDRKHERFLSDKELADLGQALRAAAASGENPRALTIIKLLVFTGARKGEIAQLRWDEVDFSAGLLKLADSKTGQKTLLLNAPARAVLSEVERIDASRFVFPATRGDGHFEGVSKVWRKVRHLAGLTEVRLHDLRHSFASVAVAGGASLPVIGALLGHAHAATTQRYAHLGDDPIRGASDRVGQAIASVFDPISDQDGLARRNPQN